MKKLIATALLGLAVSPVFAGTINETVDASRITDTNAVSAPAEFNYSPLYQQVSGDFNGETNQVSDKMNSRFTYSPLYLKVVGKMS